MNKEIEEAAKAYAYKIINVLNDYARDFDSEQYGLPTGLESGNDKVNEMVNLILPILNQWQSQQPLTVKPVEDKRRIKDVLLGLLNYIDVTGSSIRESSIFKDADGFLNTYRTPDTPVKAVEGETITGVDRDSAFNYFEQHKLRFTGINAGEYLDREDFYKLFDSTQQPQMKLGYVIKKIQKVIDRLDGKVEPNTDQYGYLSAMKHVIKWLDESYEPETPNEDAEPFILRKFNSDKYYWCKCENCGWEDSSEFTEGCHQIADTGDHSDPVCPVCFSNKLEGEAVLDVPENYAGIVEIKIPLSLVLDPFKKTIKQADDIIEQYRYPSLELNEPETKEGIQTCKECGTSVSTTYGMCMNGHPYFNS